MIFCHTGKDPNKIWDQIDDALRHAYLKTEPLMIKSASNFRSKRNFFEMVRFDFVVDEDLNVYIMEVRQVQIIIYFDINQCFSTARPWPGTRPWHQLYRAARGLRKLQYARRFH